MTSPAKVLANRLNALYSTGPRTAEGKQTASLNAVRHGLTAETPVLPDEDAAAYEALRDRLQRELAPVGAVEEVLVDRLTSLAWRLRRLGLVEVLVFNRYRDDWPGEPNGAGLSFIRACNQGDIFSKLSRYEGEIARSFHRTLHELERLQATRREPAALLTAGEAKNAGGVPG